MKLLFLTQVLDRQDAILGFVSRWVRGLAAECERVRVVALEVGDTRDLPPNVDWREIGRRGRVARWLRYRRALREAFGQGFDASLAHMVPRYALLAHGPARRAGAREYLWYTHGGVDARLVRAVGRVRKVFTASPESMRVDTPKRVVTGHGIDLGHFAPQEPPQGPPRLLSVGRLTPRKDPLTIVAAAGILRARGHDVHLDWAGAGLAAGDAAYARAVLDAIDTAGLEGHVTLHGEVPYPEIPALYRQATVVVNASLTGSVDKAALEAMACARPVVSCNESVARLLRELGEPAEGLAFAPHAAGELADRIEGLLALGPGSRAALGARLRGLVERDHDVDRLMRRLVQEMDEA